MRDPLRERDLAELGVDDAMVVNVLGSTYANVFVNVVQLDLLIGKAREADSLRGRLRRLLEEPGELGQLRLVEGEAG